MSDTVRDGIDILQIYPHYIQVVTTGRDQSGGKKVGVALSPLALARMIADRLVERLVASGEQPKEPLVIRHRLLSDLVAWIVKAASC